jgi:hypothetical protein
LGAYLQHDQFAPLGRTDDVLEDLYDCQMFEATLVSSCNGK